MSFSHRKVEDKVARETIFDYPVVSASELPDFIANELGIVPWEKLAPTVNMSEYLKRDLTKNEIEEALRFGPKQEVLFLKNPSTDKPFTGFRGVGKPWATTIAFIEHDGENYVPLVAEWKHGCETITIVPPSGIPKKGETYADAGKREFLEETGLELDWIYPLAKGIPQAASGRQYNGSGYLFLGGIKRPVVRQWSKLDENELAKVFVMKLSEWRNALKAGIAVESVSTCVTYLALEHLGWL
ncbi:MAG: NUDIX domain-containing protein [Candidatus Magasanikbacteria bacterium]